MKLSEMVKPTPEEEAAREAALLANQAEIVIEDGDDEDEDGNLMIAIEQLRRSQNILLFFSEINDQAQILGEKGSEALKDLIEENEDFLGDYIT